MILAKKNQPVNDNENINVICDNFSGIPEGSLAVRISVVIIRRTREYLTNTTCTGHQIYARCV
jgi:hypothetical protein